MSAILFRYLKGVVVCSIAGFFCAYQFMLQGATAVMVPQLVSGLGLDLADVGLLTSSFLYVYVVFQLPGGVIADRYSARILLVLCNLLIAGACYWFSVADSMLEASMARGLMGVATSPAIVICMSLVSRWFPDRWFCGLSGLVEAFALVGGALSPLVIPHLMAQTDWREAMFLMAIPGCVLALCSALWVRSYPEHNHGAETNAHRDSELENTPEQPFCGFRYGLYCVFGFGMFGMISCFGGLWGIPFLNIRFPGQQEAVAFSISMVFIGAGAGAPLLGFLAALIKPGVMMTVTLLAGMACTGLLLFCQCPLSLMAFLCFVTGFSCGGYMLVFGQVKRMAPGKFLGILLAGANGSMLLAGPVMQPLIGWMLDQRASNHVGALTVYDYQVSLLPLLVAQFLALIACALLALVKTTDYPA